MYPLRCKGIRQIYNYYIHFFEKIYFIKEKGLYLPTSTSMRQRAYAF